MSYDFKGPPQRESATASLLPWAILRRIRQIQTALQEEASHPSYHQTDELKAVFGLDIDGYLRLARVGTSKGGPDGVFGLNAHLHDLLAHLLRAEAVAARLKGELVPSARAICWRLWNKVDA